MSELRYICNNCFRVNACCFVNINTVTYFTSFLCPFKQRDVSVMRQSDLLHTVRSSWHNILYYWEGTFRSPFVSFVGHASAQVLWPITFTQRFRTTWHLFSTQWLWKPKILNVEDKRTKFEWSKRDLGQFSESWKWSLTRAQLSKHIDLRCF